MPTDETRAAHAALVPVYVRAEGDAWALADTASDETLSTHDTARQALIAATAREDVKALGKRANLRQDGEPIGVWRWLDASAEEDESIGGSRITASSLWEMAAALNERRSAIPINGGGSVRGLGDSAPHGDAYTGGDHLANGFAHLGFPVIDEDGRTHIYLRGELLPEIAAEFDLGRLAYGSIRFGFDEADPNDDFAVKGAVLISHALTNDPAVTTLTAGSERRRSHEPVNVACRTRRTSTMANKPAAQRGPVADVLAKIAGMLGIDLDKLEENPWCVSDAVYALQDGAKVEKILDAATSAPAPAEGEVAAEARARAVLRSLASAKREVEGVEPGDVDAMLSTLVDLGREVLGKPDALPADIVAELAARKDEIGKALAPAEPPPPDEVEEERAPEGKPAAEALDEDPEKVDGKPKDEDEKQRAALADLATLRARVADAAVETGKLAADLTAERAKVTRYETREWLDGEIAKRGLSVPAKQREQYLTTALEKGRDVVGMILDARNAPPMSNPLDSVPAPAEQPATQKAAWDACDPDAQREMDEAEAKRAERERRPVRAVPRHEVRARAQKLARERFPALFPAPADADAR